MRQLFVLSVLGLTMSVAAAQGVYRIVGPDGRVTFSDQPPPSSAGTQSAGTSGRSGNDGTGSALPYELRQVANRYPVTLYSGAGCGPCDSGRRLLITRGIPFTEKTVNTADDANALKRISGDSNLPLLTIGKQQVKGFSSTEWSSYLDAAGYPAKSSLPASYRQAAATPMVEAKPAPAAAAPTSEPPAATAPAEQPTPVVPSPSNPAGIRF